MLCFLSPFLTSLALPSRLVSPSFLSSFFSIPLPIPLYSISYYSPFPFLPFMFSSSFFSIPCHNLPAVISFIFLSSSSFLPSPIFIILQTTYNNLVRQPSIPCISFLSSILDFLSLSPHYRGRRDSLVDPVNKYRTHAAAATLITRYREWCLDPVPDNAYWTPSIGDRLCDRIIGSDGMIFFFLV